MYAANHFMVAMTPQVNICRHQQRLLVLLAIVNPELCTRRNNKSYSHEREGAYMKNYLVIMTLITLTAVSLTEATAHKPLVAPKYTDSLCAAIEKSEDRHEYACDRNEKLIANTDGSDCHCEPVKGKSWWQFWKKS